MSELDIHVTYPQSREKLTQLTNVPVDTQYMKHLTDLLEAHGARVTHLCIRHRPEAPESAFYACTIAFPAGTYREYGMMLLRTTPFTIFFPDGYGLRGADIYRTNADPGGTSTTLLYLLKQE